MNRYVCPKCGGQLAFWEEEVHETQIKIDKKTGQLCKKKKLIKSNSGDMQGIMCTCCDLSCNWINEKGIFPEKLLEDISSINF